MSEKPRITEDGGIVWERASDKTEPPSEATPPDESQRPDPEGETSSQEPETGASAPPRPVKKKRTRRRVLVALGVVAALLVAWTAYDRLTAMDGGEPPTVGESSTASGQEAREAETAATEYRSLMLSGDAQKACGMRVDEDLCLRVSGSDPEPLTASAPPTVVQSGEVTRPGEAGEEETATAVLIEFTIEDQSNAQREVVFVRSSDGKVLGTEGVGSADAGKTLQALFEEASS